MKSSDFITCDTFVKNYWYYQEGTVLNISPDNVAVLEILNFTEELNNEVVHGKQN